MVTGLAFAGLGIGGFLLATIIIPVATLLQRNEAIRRCRAQRIIRANFRFYVRMLQWLGVIKLDVIGAEKLLAASGNLIIANHPTLLDVVLIMSLVPNAQCVVKRQLWRNPLLRQLVKIAGYIRNDLEPEIFIEACRMGLAAGNNLIIFPEGTRSVPGEPLHFQRSFAHIATLTGSSLQPVIITCDPITLVKGRPWYDIPRRVPRFCVEADDLIVTSSFYGVGRRARDARALVSHLEDYYRGKLTHA
jgi:1-acyl-sn-glycerol-3-phosphate acyltransferase